MYKKEKYEQRLYRILCNAGYSMSDAMNLSVEKMLAVKDITVPNIRTLLFLQKRLKEGKHCVAADKPELCDNRKCPYR